MDYIALHNSQKPKKINIHTNKFTNACLLFQETVSLKRYMYSTENIYSLPEKLIIKATFV